MTQLTLWDWVCECGGVYDYHRMWRYRTHQFSVRMCLSCLKLEYLDQGAGI